MVPGKVKVELKYATKTSGEQFVIMVGEVVKQWLSADNLDSSHLVYRSTDNIISMNLSLLFSFGCALYQVVFLMVQLSMDKEQVVYS